MLCCNSRLLSNQQKDRGYAWVVVFLAFCCHTVVWGLSYTIGIWTSTFEEAFGASKAVTSTIGSGLTGTNYIAGLLGSLLCKHYGNRKVIMVGALIGTLGFCLSFYAPTIEYLFFTFSLMIGSGLGITFVPAVEIINEYFDTRKTIAFGLSLSGVGCGMLVYPPFNNLLITQLGWRYALLANCGITLFLFICGFLLKPIEVNTEEFEDGLSIYSSDNSEVASSTLESCNDNLKNVSLLDQLFDSLRLFQNVSFSLFCINNVLFFGALTILWVHLNGYILKSGYSSSEAGWIYSIIGISNVCGRVFLGILCDHKRVNPVVIFTIGNFFLALNELYASHAQSYQAVIVTNVIFGFVSAVGGPVLPSIIIEFLGQENLAMGYGFLLIFEGVGSFAGPPLAGLLYNLTESYDCAFYFAASLFLMGGAVMALPVLKFHKADPGRPIHATRSTSTIETQTFSDEDKFLTD